MLKDLPEGMGSHRGFHKGHLGDRMWDHLVLRQRGREGLIVIYRNRRNILVLLNSLSVKLS